MCNLFCIIENITASSLVMYVEIVFYVIGSHEFQKIQLTLQAITLLSCIGHLYILFFQFTQLR